MTIHTQNNGQKVITISHSSKREKTVTWSNEDNATISPLTSIILKDGNNDGDKEESTNENPVLNRWTEKMGISMNITDSKTLQLQARPRVIEEARQASKDEKFREDLQRGMLQGLKARKLQKIDQEWEKRNAEEDANLTTELLLVRIHLKKRNTVLDNNKVKKADLFSAIGSVTGLKDDKPIKTCLKKYMEHGYFRALDTKETRFIIDDKFFKLSSIL
jgi:hypothetical protein